MDRSWRTLAPCLFVLGLTASAPAAAEESPARFDPSVRHELREPVVLSSKDGVLEVRLTAKQGEARLDTVEKPVDGFLLFAYELIRGTASNGATTGENLYPSPTLQVNPGETLIVHLDNAMSGLTIADFMDPSYTREGENVPLYPAQLTESPINLHVHGLHVSPKGNADNVLLHIAAGLGNTYTYNIPKSMPQGAYWYHSHLHTLTAPQVYMGLAGLLAIGRTDGNIPAVTENQIPIRNMLLQYNYVFGRDIGMSTLNNYSWSMWVNTTKPPESDELANGTYRPLLTPVNFLDTKPGTEMFTIWYAGPLSIRNERGRFEFIPSNLQRFTPFAASGGNSIPPDPSIPDYKRDVQFTVNGQFQPVVKSKRGQTEIWVLCNISDIVYIPVQLTETATGRHPKIAIVGQDGVPYPQVHNPIFENGTRLLIPPASRYAIAVTMPEEGDVVLEMPERGGGASTISAPGVLYTNNGTPNPPAVLGNVSVLPSAISYYDGFFVSPTQVLLKATTDGGKGKSTPFVEGQTLDAYTPFRDISRVTPDFERPIDITGGFLNDLASKSDAKAFIYAFANMAFPNVALIQPRVNSIEEWRFSNYNNDEHPIHIHVNDFQVTHYLDPTRGIETGPEMWGVDNANVPAPVMGAEESVIQVGELALRMSFDDFTGLFVMHCHRLNHEDNGLMALVNVIPNVSSYAVVVPGAQGQASQVKVFDGNGDKLLATVTPFPGYVGEVSVAMGDVNDDGVWDLVAGAGKDHAPEVVAYSGKGADGREPFATELARFMAFAPEERGGISVTAALVDAVTTADNIIVGSPPGVQSEVKVFSSKLPAVGTAPAVFSSFDPYEDDKSGVTLTSGFVDFATGRNSIVTAPGPGAPTQIKVFAYSLFKPIGAKIASAEACPPPGDPIMSSAFMPFGTDYRGGVSLATGWFTGAIGGAERIAVGQRDGSGVKIYGSGSALDGGPAIYLHSPATHQSVKFTETASFEPFAGSKGVTVAATSTTTGADLLVSGVVGGTTAEVRKYQFVRPTPKATMLEARRLSDVASAPSGAPNALGGD